MRDSNPVIAVLEAQDASTIGKYGLVGRSGAGGMDDLEPTLPGVLPADAFDDASLRALGEGVKTTMARATSLLAQDPLNVGPYRNLGRLGVGGMGVVYLATGPTGDHVALKVMREDLSSQPEFRTRFAREVRAAQAVTGPYTARLIDADTESSVQWIASEYVSGPTLSEQIDAHGPLAQEQVRLLGLGLAEALEAIHEAGLVHRDLKPSNIILSADGPRVIDFGVSVSADATSITQTGVSVGSLAWMSPEQVTGASLGPTSDVFSWGLVVAFAALARHPYGDGRPEAQAWRVVNAKPELAGLPQSLRYLVGRALTAAPDQRATPTELVSVLAAGATQVVDVNRVMATSWDATIAESHNAATAPTAILSAHSDAGTARVAGPGGADGIAQATARNPARRRGWLVGAGALALTGVVAGAWLTVGSDADATTTPGTSVAGVEASAVSEGAAPGLDDNSDGSLDDSSGASTGTQQSESVVGPPRYERSQAAPVGSRPHSLSMAPQGGPILMTDRGTNRTGVSLVDPESLQVTSILATPGEPASMAMTPDGEQVFTGIRDTSLVRAFALSSGDFTDINVGSRVASLDVSPDGDYVFAALPDERTIAKIDANTKQIVDRISNGNVPSSVRVAPSGDHLITSNRTTDSVTIINLSDASSAQIPVGASPRRVRISPDGTLAATANKGDDTISLIDIKSKRELARIPVGVSPRAAEFTPDGRAILVTNHGDGTVSVVDVAERSATQTIPFGPTPLGLLVTDSMAYITHEDTGEVTILNRAGA